MTTMFLLTVHHNCGSYHPPVMLNGRVVVSDVAEWDIVLLGAKTLKDVVGVGVKATLDDSVGLGIKAGLMLIHWQR